jgi:hypothetical protein
MAARPDLNGQLWTHPVGPQGQGAEPWFLIDRGQRRGIPSAAFSKFLVNVGQLIVNAEVDQIDRGADYPDDIGLVECIENGAIFLRESNVLRGIPSGQVFDLYHFKRATVEKWPQARILQHTDGPQIEPPTVTPLIPPPIQPGQVAIDPGAGGGQPPPANGPTVVSNSEGEGPGSGIPGIVKTIADFFDPG